MQTKKYTKNEEPMWHYQSFTEYKKANQIVKMNIRINPDSFE